ncbi:origin recognition complex subunit 2-domain-containing protein [Xylariaceae sp. FL0255]|nr:origin recognition complex subunit 2-domain-containing protein [Xylariaceae sp. FL0255]
MVRTKRNQADAGVGVATMVSETTPRKRRHEDIDDLIDATPSKRRSTRPSSTKQLHDNAHSEYDFPSDDEMNPPASSQYTPKKRGRPTSSRAQKENGEVSTPRNRKSKNGDVVTPSRNRSLANGVTPRTQRNDRSARKKSARALIEKVVAGESSDEEAGDDIAREIYESSEDSELEEDLNGGQEEGISTPSRTSRGRIPKTKKGAQTRKKSPTPPRDLPPHELYFAQNKPGAAKTSNNTLTSLKLLTHEEYFSKLREHKDPHEEDIEFLNSIHVHSFPQWSFELSQRFSVCLFGYGSKRALLHKFAKHIYDGIPDHEGHKIVIVNGYVRANVNSLREILGVIASAVDPKHKLAAGGPPAMMDSLKGLLSAHDVTITVILNSIDAAPLRRPGFQSILAQLAMHPQIHFVCSADTPDFTLLWDSGLRSSFSFVFHDCTTFAPFTAELEVVDDVHELLGRKARRVGGKEGVTYVLRSLTENARNLYRLLVGEVLVAMDDEAESLEENPGVEYRMLYNKAVEEFICSSEMAFRTLLKEFHDHQMITSRKDVLGTELLSIPFQKEELEGILEDLV